MARTSLETPIAAPLQLGNDGHTHQRRSKDSDYELPAFVNGQWQGPVAPQASSSHEDIARLQPSDPAYQTLPPADGGKQAWLFLFGCFMMEALVWGFPFSFGVFQDYYSTHPPFADSPSSIAAIGTTSTGLMYFLAPACAILTQRYPASRRPAMFVGLGVVALSLVAASFCNSVAGLVATQGVLYALGGVVMYFPLMPFVDEWFVRRKGMAFGVIWAGTGSAGVGVPFLLQWLLDSYGYRTALRTWAIVLVLLATPSLLVIKPRLPTPTHSTFRPTDLSFTTHLPFWFFLTGTIAQGLGFFIPGLYLPTISRRLSLPAFAGPLSLSLYNLACCFGALAFGFLVDAFHVTTAILISSLGLTIAVLVFWGCAQAQPMLYLFALLAGFFGGGYSTTWSGCADAMRVKDRSGARVDTAMTVALLAAGKGIGAVVCGPVSEVLLARDQWEGSLALGYGSGFGVLVVFSGVSALLGGAAWVGRVLRVV
ncbi:hypothetical protein MBLNU230_g3553t1 [Neophaeotheca triangularis]